MKRHLRTVAKAQLSAFFGGIVDYAAMIALTEFGHIHYTFSILISGCIGAVVNYFINRYWTFKATQESKMTQIPKFALMVLGSILLKSTGTTVVTEFVGFNYKISRLMVDAIVSVGFNFTLQRYWIFKGHKKS